MTNSTCFVGGSPDRNGQVCAAFVRVYSEVVPDATVREDLDRVQRCAIEGLEDGPVASVTLLDCSPPWHPDLASTLAISIGRLLSGDVEDVLAHSAGSLALASLGMRAHLEGEQSSRSNSELTIAILGGDLLLASASKVAGRISAPISAALARYVASTAAGSLPTATGTELHRTVMAACDMVEAVFGLERSALDGYAESVGTILRGITRDTEADSARWDVELRSKLLETPQRDGASLAPR
jgi:hypothetical protein